MKKTFVAGLLAAATVYGTGLVWTGSDDGVASADEKAVSAPDEAAVERSRKLVKLPGQHLQTDRCAGDGQVCP